MAIGVAILSSVSNAKDFDTNQFNLKVKNKTWGVEFREFSQSDRSHIQLERYIGDWQLGYRYDEDGVETEHRVRLDYKLLNSTHFYITPRIEHRHYEGNVDDYTRLRSAFGIRYGNLWADITPMLHFGQGKEEDLKIDEYQTKIGYAFNLEKNVVLKPFIQHEANKHFDKTNLFFGTTLEVGF
jgi:hypothetical protein